jgi:hypothetical protein
MASAADLTAFYLGFLAELVMAECDGPDRRRASRRTPWPSVSEPGIMIP